MTWRAAWGFRDEVEDEGEPPFGEHEGSFAEAKMWLLAVLKPYLTDDCEDCKTRGTAAYVELFAASDAWQGEVDGYDYWLAPD